MTDWPAYFLYNRVNRLPIPWEIATDIEPGSRRHLVRSLQRFQMGERGDGSHLKRVAATTGDPRYMAAIELFVEEEQEHAALMAQALHRLGAPVLDRHWSDRCFRLLCLLSGLRTELMVLLVAEIIAKRYFRLLYEATDDPVLRAVCAQIRQDEEAHIRFHAETLRSLLTSLPQPFWPPARVAWRLFFTAVCLVVVYDHRKLLLAAGSSPHAFWGNCLRIFERVAEEVFVPHPIPVSDHRRPARGQSVAGRGDQ
jgi:hypothetical protein